MRLFVPVTATLVLLVMVAMFLFGDLGVLASFEKKRQIRVLREEIEVLQERRLTKALAIERLQGDPAAIRALALRYGLKGGQGPAVVHADERTAPLVADDPGKPFLLRHPLLVLIGLLIVILVLFYRFIYRRVLQRGDAEGESADRAKVIKPSWS